METSGAGWGVDGVSVTIGNQTGREIIVREVALVTEGKHELDFYASGEVRTSSAARFPSLSRKELERLVKEGGGSLFLRSSYTVLAHKEPVDGFVTVSPFTAHTFRLRHHVIAALKAEPKSVRILVEFRTFSDSVALLEVYAKSQSMDILKNMIAETQRQYASRAEKPPSLPIRLEGVMEDCTIGTTLSQKRQPGLMIIRPPEG